MLFKLKRGFRAIYRTMLAISCIAMVILFTACTNNNNNDLENENNNKDVKYTKAIFERNNNIYIYDEVKQQLQPIGDTVKFKELMVLSPDKKNVAFKYFYKENTSTTEVVVYNIGKKKYETINIEDTELKNIIELKWIDKNRILVVAALNPAVLKYGIYDINSKQMVNSAKGLLMDVLNNGDLLLFSKTSRGEEKQKSNLYLGDKLLYEIDNTTEEIHFATISQDKKHIAFRTIIYGLGNGEVKEFLYTGKLDINKVSVSGIKKVDIPSNIMGELYFDKDNNLFVKNEENTYKVDGTFFSLLENKAEQSKTPSEEQLNTFKQVLKKTFVDEFIEDYLQLDELQIYNIQWF